MDTRYLESLQQIPGIEDVQWCPALGPDGAVGEITLKTARTAARLRALERKTHFTEATLSRVLQAERDPRACVIFAPRISRPMGQRLAEAGMNYVDLAGNCHVQAEGLTIHVEGKTPVRDPRGRGLGGAGYGVLFALLAQPELLTRPVRHIGVIAGASRQAVSKTLLRLEARGAIVRQGRTRAWVDSQRPWVLDQWLAGYEARVRPTLLIGTYQMAPAMNENTLAKTLRNTPGFRWGGVSAASRLHGYYKDPGHSVLHVRDERLLATAGVRLSATADGNLTLLRFPPGDLALESAAPSTIHPLYAWAEMMTSADDRAHEAADVMLATLAPHTQPLARR